MKNIALSLGLKEDATTDEINEAAGKLNLKVIDGKLVNKKEASKKDDDDDDDDDDAVKNDADIKKSHNDLKKSHNALRKEHDKLVNRVEKMEDAFKKMKNSSDTDKVGNKLIALVKAGKVANKAEVLAKVKAQLEKDFDLASEVYDALPGKLVANTEKPMKLNVMIAKAADEHAKNKGKIEAAIKEGTEEEEGEPAEEVEGVHFHIDEQGRKIKNTGVAIIDGKEVKAKSVSLSDARKELTAKSE